MRLKANTQWAKKKLLIVQNEKKKNYEKISGLLMSPNMT